MKVTLTAWLPPELTNARIIGTAQVDFPEGGRLHVVLVRCADTKARAVYWDRNASRFATIEVAL